MRQAFRSSVDSASIVSSLMLAAFQYFGFFRSRIRSFTTHDSRRKGPFVTMFSGSVHRPGAIFSHFSTVAGCTGRSV